MAYTAADVKTLRERTGAGMMDCKKALDETGGDLESSVDVLRAKGLAAAVKKSSRTAAEGLVGVAVSGLNGVAVEVNSETDFVAKNDQFQDFVRNTTQVALDTAAADVDVLKDASYPGGGTVSEKLTNKPAVAPSEACLGHFGRGRALYAQRRCCEPGQDRRARRARIDAGR
jgi:elongation factor Ts